MINPLLPLFFLCWGSFLNVLGYRLIVGLSPILRSHCIHCSQQLAWYDLIPVVSWIILLARCRSCLKTISWLYPFIELLSAVLFTALYLTVPSFYFFSYFIFFSALIVTIRSDFETMMISQYATLFLMPVAFFFAWMELLPITLAESIIGALFGYACLYIPAKLCLLITGKEGLGVGDLELLAFIGAFVGSTGVWITLLLGSLAGSLFGVAYLIINKADRSAKIPFGPFLAFGAIAAVLGQNYIMECFLIG